MGAFGTFPSPFSCYISSCSAIILTYPSRPLTYSSVYWSDRTAFSSLEVMTSATHQHLPPGASIDAGPYSATEWSTMVVGQCNGSNLRTCSRILPFPSSGPTSRTLCSLPLHTDRYEPEQLARWAHYGQVGPIVCADCSTFSVLAQINFGTDVSSRKRVPLL